MPVDLVDEPLQGLIARGMAKDPRDRPPNAIEFVAELELRWPTAPTGRTGRSAAAASSRSAPRPCCLLLLGGIAGAAGGSFAATLLGGMGRRKKAVIAGAAVGIFAAIAVTTTTLALTGNNSSGSPGTAATESGRRRAGHEPGRRRHARYGLAHRGPVAPVSPTAQPLDDRLAHRQPPGHQPDHESARHQRADH